MTLDQAYHQPAVVDHADVCRPLLGHLFSSQITRHLAYHRLGAGHLPLPVSDGASVEKFGRRGKSFSVEVRPIRLQGWVRQFRFWRRRKYRQHPVITSNFRSTLANFRLQSSTSGECFNFRCLSPFPVLASMSCCGFNTDFRFLLWTSGFEMPTSGCEHQYLIRSIINRMWASTSGSYYELPVLIMNFRFSYQLPVSIGDFLLWVPTSGV